MKQFKAIITVGQRQYSVVMDAQNDMTAGGVLALVRSTLIDEGGVFDKNDNQALEVNCGNKYDSIVVELAEHTTRPVVTPTAESTLDLEYERVDRSLTFLGNKIDVAAIVYYNKGRVVLMPLLFNDETAYGYMREDNIKLVMQQLATDELYLDAGVVDVLVYPGDVVEEEAVDYIRDWIKEAEDRDFYLGPKEKTAKAFTGWRLEGKG